MDLVIFKKENRTDQATTVPVSVPVPISGEHAGPGSDFGFSEPKLPEKTCYYPLAFKSINLTPVNPRDEGEIFRPQTRISNSLQDLDWFSVCMMSFY